MNTDNQQGTLTDAEAGWLAGIIDGEGSITLNVRRKSWKGWNGVGVDLQIMLVNTDAGIIHKAVSLVEKLIGSPPHLFEQKTRDLYRQDGSAYRNAGKSLLHMSIAKMSHIKAIIEAIEPHLAGEKKARAALVHRFIVRRMARKGEHTKDGPSWYDGYDWQIVREFYELKGGKLLPEVQGLLNEQEQGRSPLKVVA